MSWILTSTILARVRTTSPRGSGCSDAYLIYSFERQGTRLERAKLLVESW